MHCSTPQAWPGQPVEGPVCDIAPPAWLAWLPLQFRVSMHRSPGGRGKPDKVARTAAAQKLMLSRTEEELRSNYQAARARAAIC